LPQGEQSWNRSEYDAATGNVLFEKDVEGKVIIGLMGGDSAGATRGLAKEVAKVTKKKFF
jgi:maltose-binding protein MalE